MAGARLARNEGRQRARRSMTSTLPADFAPSSRAWLSDRPSWCVDMGPSLLAMTTCDLWLSLARNDVTPRTKVWREGMPYWEALEKVPEFALAMPDATVWGTGETAAPATAKVPVEEMSTGTSGARSAMGREPSAAGVITMAPPSDFATPAPVVVEHRSPAPAPAPNKRRIFPRLDRRGAVSVAFGAAVAVGALTLATTGPVSPIAGSGGLSEPPRAAAIRYEAPAVDLATIVRAASDRRDEAPATDLVSPGSAGDRRAAPPASSAASEGPGHAPRGPHAADRGQRRAR